MGLLPEGGLEVIKMKISRYAYLVIGLAALLGVFAVANQNSGFSTDTSILTMELPQKEGLNAKPTFTLNTALPTVPDKVGIYGMSSEAVTADSTKNLAAAKLKVSKEAITKVQVPSATVASKELLIKAAPVTMEAAKTTAASLDLTKLQAKDVGTAFAIATAESYVSMSKESAAETVMLNVPGLTADRKAALPSESALKQKADEYAAANNLLPSGYNYEGTGYIEKVTLNAQGGIEKVEQVTGIVKYTRNIGGLPVEGPGSTISVTLGEGGEALGYTKISRNIGTKLADSSVTAPGLLKTMATGEKTYELMTPEDAYKKLQENGLTTEIANVDTATVDKMYLAYFEGDPTKKQTETEPVYVFEGTATGPGGSTQYKETIYALKAKNAKAPFEMASPTKAAERKAGEKGAEAKKGPDEVVVVKR
jgi:hypothetical protein